MANWPALMQISVFAVVGLAVVGLAVADVIRRRDADSIFLCLWLLGTIVFAALINWSANGRSILPAVPAMGILIVRQIERRAKTAAPLPLRWMLAPMILAASVSLWTAYSDTTLANAERVAASKICAKYGREGRPVRFQGHWGFQYYMLKYGARDTNARACRIISGEVVAMDLANPNPLDMPMRLFRQEKMVETPVSTGLATMDSRLGAGFYSDQYGPMPLVIGRVSPVETYVTIARTDVVFRNGECTSGHYRRAIDLEHQGKTGEAVAEYRAALRIEPDLWGAENSLAWILATNPRFRNGREAVLFAEAAVMLTDGKQPALLDTLAVAYASAGQYEEAVATAEKGAALAEAKHDASAVGTIRSRIPLYRAHKPYLEPLNDH